MNRYIVVNTKAKNSAVWETIGANYTPSKGEVCIVVPPTSEITKDEAAVRTSLIEQHYFSSDEKEAILALINNEEILTEEQKKSDKFNILFQNIKYIENKITHFNENGRTISIIKEDETTESKYIGPFTVEERTYLLYKLNNKINNFTKQFALHNYEGTINSLVIDDTNNNFINITLKEHESITFKVLNDYFKYKNISIGNTKIRLIPSIDVDYYETELLPPAYNINKDIKSGKEKLIEKINSIPKTEDFESADPNSPEIHYYAPGATLFTDIGDGNIVVSTENIDYTGVAPISIKIGDGTTIFRDLPTLTTGNVQGDWAATDPTNPSYIKNKPILNDDLFQQSEEKTLLIPSSSIYDEKNQLITVGLLDLFDVTYIDSPKTSNQVLTNAEKAALIYIITAGSYDLTDKTNLNTKIFVENKNKTIVVDKLRNYCKINSDISITEENFVYISNLLQNGTAEIELNKKELLLTELSKITTLEEIGPTVNITVKDQTNIKTFHQEEYIKISDHYFHPNDLLIYNDNNWGYYEINMFGRTAPFYANEIKYLNYLINNNLDESIYSEYTSLFQTLLKTKINNYISEAKYKNYLLNKLNFIIPDSFKTDTIIEKDENNNEISKNIYIHENDVNILVEQINQIINNYNNKNNSSYSQLDLKQSPKFKEKINFIINYLNNDILQEVSLSSEEKNILTNEIHDNSIINLEINKQPRFWFYKSNILKTKEKQTLTQIIKDNLYIYNNRFTLEEQDILIKAIEGKKFTDNQALKLRSGFNTKLANKIRLNSDITVNNGKDFLIERIMFNYKKDENSVPIFKYVLNGDEETQLLKQVQISKNALSNSLGETEIVAITEEILNDIIQELSLDKENTIAEGFEGENIYYEINNEIILNPVDRAIYMRLNSLKGYLKQTKNLEIIFHYKNRSFNKAYLSDLVSDWNENDPENPGYIAHRFIYQDDQGRVVYDPTSWFYRWLVNLINNKIEAWYEKELKDRLNKMEQDIDNLKKRCDNLQKQIDEIKLNNQDTYIFNRLKNLIVSQPERPILSKDFFPKIWICTDTQSGYGLVYWRQGGEDAAGHYDGTASDSVKWTPISAIWSPDTLTT